MNAGWGLRLPGDALKDVDFQGPDFGAGSAGGKQVGQARLTSILSPCFVRCLVRFGNNGVKTLLMICGVWCGFLGGPVDTGRIIDSLHPMPRIPRCLQTLICHRILG